MGTKNEPLRRRRSPRSVGTKDHGEIVGLLIGILEGIRSYDAHIVEAERARDPELADFLRELRRQDLVRARVATRLLRRIPGHV